MLRTEPLKWGANWTSSVKFRIDFKKLLTYEAVNDLAPIQVTVLLANVPLEFLWTTLKPDNLMFDKNWNIIQN